LGLQQDHINKVGFVVVGLNHILENNQWNTSVRANMIFLKEKTEFSGSVVRIDDRTGQFGENETRPSVPSNFNGQTNFKVNPSLLEKDARSVTEKYLGRTLADNEWNSLIAAIYAEASSNAEERANIAAVILNRAKNKTSGIIGVLVAPLQFESVTGNPANPGPRKNYLDGPSSVVETQIYNAIKTYLPKLQTKYLNFTSANRSLYFDNQGRERPGINSKFYTNAIAKGWKEIGGTLFGNA